MSELFEPNYAEIQMEFSNRVIYDPVCRSCQHFDVPAEGAHERADHAGWIAPCDECQRRKPFAWVRFVDRNRFRDWMRARPQHPDGSGPLAFPLTDLNELKEAF